MKAQKEETLKGIYEEFKAVDVKALDSKNRLNLSEKVLKLLHDRTKVDAYKVFIGEDGDILLRPVVNIPSKEAWIYRNPKVLRQIRQGLTEAQRGQVEKAKKLDKFFESL